MDKQAEAAVRLQNVLFDDVYLPRFKQACAQQGIEFADEDELTAGLETAAMLKSAETQLRNQGIDPRPSPKKQARNMLKQAMFGSEQETQGAENVKSALSELLAVSAESESGTEEGAGEQTE